MARTCASFSLTSATFFSKACPFPDDSLYNSRLNIVHEASYSVGAAQGMSRRGNRCRRILPSSGVAPASIASNLTVFRPSIYITLL